MARLNEACESFIASLEKAQAELDQIANRLEEEFCARYKGSSINPMDVLTRINKIRHELPVLANECAEVLQAKQECVDAAKSHLSTNGTELSRLQRRAGIDDHHNNEEVEMLQAFKAAVEELESKMRLGGGGGIGGEQQPVDRSALNAAIVHSVVT